MDGEDRSLAATSPQERADGSAAWAEEGRSSPNQKKPKKAVQEIAQIMTFSGWLEDQRWSWMRDRIWMVIGKHMRVCIPLSILALLIPAWTRFRMGREDCSHGSGKPSEICMLRTADKYDLPVWGARPSSARKARKEQRSCSDTGKGLGT